MPYDIEMSTDDTLELDTIIENSSRASKPINKIDTYANYDKNDLEGIQTHTSIFDPPEPGEYDIYVNGQVLSINVTDASTIPDSVVSRAQDNGANPDIVEKRGIAFESDDDWPEIEGVISADTVGITTAYIYRISDVTLMDSVDVSGLSAGDTFRFDNAGLSANTDYAMVADADGAGYSAGRNSGDFSYPQESSDGRLRIIGRTLEQNDYAVEGGAPYHVVTIGNVSGFS